MRTDLQNFVVLFPFVARLKIKFLFSQQLSFLTRDALPAICLSLSLFTRKQTIESVYLFVFFF